MSNNEPSTCDHEVCGQGEREDIAAAVRHELQSRYIVTHHDWHAPLETLLRNREGVAEVFRDSTESVFQIGF